MRNRSGFGWLELVIGILLIVLGVLSFVTPGYVITVLVFICGAAAIIMGIADIILYTQLERYSGFGPILSLVTGILSVMSGLMLVLHPQSGVLVLTILFPVWFIAHCISRLSNLHHIRLVAGKGLYNFTLAVNIIGLILGFLMLMSPVFTLTTIRCLAGIYLILLGIDAVVVAFSRMGRRL